MKPLRFGLQMRIPNQTAMFQASEFHFKKTTLPETKSKFAPENGWLEYEFVSFWVSTYFQRLDGC